MTAQKDKGRYRANRGPNPEGRIHEEVDGSTYFPWNQLVDRRIDGSVLAANSKSREEPANAKNRKFIDSAVHIVATE